MELVFVLILAAGYAIFFVIKSLSTIDGDVMGTPVGREKNLWNETYESFPAVESVKTAKSDNAATADKKNAGKASAATCKEHACSDAEVVHKDVEVIKTDKISLKSRAAAKRAFVESEIFNRKY